MSGLLRRIKRSRPADAGEALPEGQAAAPEGAPTPAEAPVFGPAPAPVYGPEPPPAAPAAEPPVLLADPNVPAGVDPAAAPMRPPAGRRGRLRRRLRYLRRARELMLRDLGGLLYEVYRTGGGNVAAHEAIVAAKVQRLSGLDAEAHAIETALAAPRAEAVLFQPGIGGTCGQCGELYGSEARFCSHCGAAIDAVPAGDAAPAEADAAPDPVVRPRRRFWQRRRAAAAAPAEDEGAGATAAEAQGDDATAVLATAGEAPATGEPAAQPAATDETAAQPSATDETAAEAPATDEPAAQPAATSEPAAEAPATDETATDEAPAAEPAPDAAPEPATEAPQDAPDAAPAEPAAGEPPRDRMSNGRAEDPAPPGLSSGDPLVSRERS